MSPVISHPRSAAARHQSDELSPITITVDCPAKTNLTLEVGPAHDEWGGRHELDTIYCAIGVYDTVTATAKQPGAGFSLELEGAYLGDLASSRNDMRRNHAVLALFAMAQAAANAGDNLRALNETEKSLQLRPDWETAAIARAQIQARHSGKTAIESLGDFVDRHPNASEARLTLARLLIAEKRYTESRQHFDRLVKDNPDNPEVIYPVAMLALQNGDTATGRNQLENLLKTDFPDKGTIHFFLGQLDQEQKRPEAALAHYQQVTAGEQYIPARSRAAQILMQQGKANEARELLRDTRGGTPAERTQLTLAESQLLREAGRHNDAYIVLDRALTAQPNDPELLYEAALTAERIGKPEILEIHLKHLLALKPDHPHALNALGYSLAERNLRLAEAHDLIAKALSLAPEDPFIMDSMGWVLYRQGKLTEALQTLENAFRLKADPEIAAHLGEVLWSLERKDEARRILKDAYKAHPENETLASTVKKLLP